MEDVGAYGHGLGFTSLDEAFAAPRNLRPDEVINFGGDIRKPPKIEAEEGGTKINFGDGKIDIAEITEKFKSNKDKLKDVNDVLQKGDKYLSSLSVMAMECKTILRNTSQHLISLENTITVEEYGDLVKKQAEIINFQDTLILKARENVEKKQVEISKKHEELIKEQGILGEFLKQGAIASLSEEQREKVVSLCPICYDKSVNTVCIPCGHTFCSGCIKDKDIGAFTTSQDSNKCPTCRTTVRQKVKIFLP